jgi:hypothetical protein
MEFWLIATRLTSDISDLFISAVTLSELSEPVTEPLEVN